MDVLYHLFNSNSNLITMIPFNEIGSYSRQLMQ